MFVLDRPLEFKPIPGSRRPEMHSWAFGLALAGLLAVIRPDGGAALFGAWALGLYFGISAALMSVGNWLERNARLTLSATGLAFRQPLHGVTVGWEAVERLEVRSSPVGRRIFVFGGGKHFSFRAISEVEIRGKIRDRYGFEDSERIMQTMLQMTNLPAKPKEFENGTYYARD
ncbi:MAG: hypothetical protein HYZ26_12630 [Chloroflexi bacterium]|nr:hypothetical protein [Chloroflexota bacterium]